MRVAGIINVENKFILMHRTNVQNHPIGNYYTIPGGGVEEGETLEEALKREIQEEVGIEINVKKEFFHLKKQDKEEYFFLCEYVSGTIGSGTGPEFSNDPNYAHRGEYAIEMVSKENIVGITLLPPEIKGLIVDMK